jgi:hypothetical protein
MQSFLRDCSRVKFEMREEELDSRKKSWNSKCQAELWKRRDESLTRNSLHLLMTKQQYT